MKKPLLFLLLLAHTSLLTYAQQADSLKRLLEQGGLHDTARVNIYIDLSIAIEQTDTSIFYAKQGLELARQANYLIGMAQASRMIGLNHKLMGNFDSALYVYQQGLLYSQQAKSSANEANLLNNIGVLYRDKGHYDSAVYYYQQSLGIRKELGFKTQVADSYNNLGVAYRNMGNYDKAVSYYFEALKVYEELGGKEYETGRLYNNIGNVYYHQGYYDKAIEYYEKSLAIRQALGNKAGMAYVYRNMGSAYTELKQYDRAVAMQEQGLLLARELNRSLNIASACLELSNLYMDQAMYDRALPYLEEGLQLATSNQSLEFLAPMKSAYARYFNIHKKYDKAYAYASQAYAHAKEGQNLFNISIAAQQLSEAAEGLGKASESLAAFKRYISLRDSIANEDNQKKALSQEFAHKEERLALEQEKERIAHQAELEQQALIRNSFIGGFMLMLVLAVVSYRSYQRKQKDNKLLTAQQKEIAEKNNHLNQANEELSQQQEELLVLNENLEVQKQTVETTYQQLKHTTEQLDKSIEYASHIQGVVLPEEVELQQFFNDVFVLFCPKDVVSGDFYWFSQINEHLAVFALADCTGHGVPGAFMSMLGSTLLHETINIKKVEDDPARILRNLHSGLRNILRQHEGKNDDGMDISIGIFKRNPAEGTTELTFSGAKSKMFYYTEAQGLEQLSGDNQYIGGHALKRDFTNQVITLPANATCYFFSDGYTD